MENIALCSPEHEEVFRRVWNRVMAGHPDTGCPVEVTGDLSCRCLEQLVATMPSNLTGGGVQPSPAAQTAAPPQPDQRPAPPADQPGSDMPMAGMELPQSDDTTTRLRQQVMESLEGWQMYRHLARRTRSGTARTLAALAADLHRQARRLSAAYFLLTGLRYWPSETLGTPAISSFWGTLRQRHQAEQQAEQSFRMSADELTDSTLLEMYRQLADGCRSRCRQLRTMLEQSCP